MWSALVSKSGDGAPSHPACFNFCQPSVGTAKPKHTLSLQTQPPPAVLVSPARKQSMPRPEGTGSGVLPCGAGRTCATSESSLWCPIAKASTPFL